MALLDALRTGLGAGLADPRERGAAGRANPLAGFAAPVARWPPQAALGAERDRLLEDPVRAGARDAALLPGQLERLDWKDLGMGCVRTGADGS